MYIQKRRQRFYALHDIPEDVQGVIGRPRFVVTLETADRKLAEQRARVWELQWRTQIARARATATSDPVIADANYWLEAVRGAANEEERDAIRDHVANLAKDMADRAAQRAGTEDHRDGYDEVPGVVEAARLAQIVDGRIVALIDHMEPYLTGLSIAAKTVDMKRSIIKRFSNRFTYVSDVKRKGVQAWVYDLLKEGAQPPTVRRFLSDLRGYWAYLRASEIVDDDFQPFEHLLVPKQSTNGKGAKRQPFTAREVVRLHRTAKERDPQLGDLITLAMWTGARIQELCSLPVTGVGKGYINIGKAKTEAGVRQVPVHSKLKPTIERLIKDSKDGFVLSGLTANKYGNRANAIDKRFTRLKRELGFGPQHVFHSIRKTVATLLENAGVPENVSADILGHDKPTMTYGLYSGGTSLPVKRDAIEKLRY